MICFGLVLQTIGPICFAIIAEVSSTRLRSKTIVLACNTYNIALIVSNILQPNMFNSEVSLTRQIVRRKFCEDEGELLTILTPTCHFLIEHLELELGT